MEKDGWVNTLLLARTNNILATHPTNLYNLQGLSLEDVVSIFDNADQFVIAGPNR